jgi:hypothetical protein
MMSPLLRWQYTSFCTLGLGVLRAENGRLECLAKWCSHRRAQCLDVPSATDLARSGARPRRPMGDNRSVGSARQRRCESALDTCRSRNGHYRVHGGRGVASARRRQSFWRFVRDLKLPGRPWMPCPSETPARCGAYSGTRLQLRAGLGRRTADGASEGVRTKAGTPPTWQSGRIAT